MCTIINIRKLSALKRILNNYVSYTHNLQCSTKVLSREYERDPKPIFTDPEVQKLLQSITQLDVYKVFRKTTVDDNSSEYRFMTTEQLEEEFRNTVQRARDRLQMPPVVKIKQDVQKVISKDPGLKNFSDTKYVITDITYGLRQSDRRVVVRQTDGTLEYAELDVAKRCRQAYFPLNGRKIRTPRMFEEEHFKRCLDEHKYEFILNRLTVQYEPYEREFHRFSGLVYEHINETKQFDLLRSTRHFGPMAFYYAWHKCIDDLLYDMIRRDYLRNGAELIALMYKINNVEVNYTELFKQLEIITLPTDLALEELRKSIKTPSNGIQEDIKTAIGKTKEDFESDELCLKFIEQYISQHALKKVQLELAVQTLKEINTEKKQLFEGLSKAHGIQL